jgi:hypothetical protein
MHRHAFDKGFCQERAGQREISDTSASGINAPVPLPASPPMMAANSATPATRTSCHSETSAKSESTVKA